MLKTIHMPNKPPLLLGLMSGTSADAIEVALATATPPKLLNHTTRPLPAPIRAEILRIAEGAPTTAAQISQLNFRLGHAFAEAVLSSLRQFRISPSRIALIGSHGQTIFHQGPSRSFSPLATRHFLQRSPPLSKSVNPPSSRRAPASPPSPIFVPPTSPQAAKARPWSPSPTTSSTATRSSAASPST